MRPQVVKHIFSTSHIPIKDLFFSCCFYIRNSKKMFTSIITVTIINCRSYHYTIQSELKRKCSELTQIVYIICTVIDKQTIDVVRYHMKHVSYKHKWKVIRRHCLSVLLKLCVFLYIGNNKLMVIFGYVKLDRLTSRSTLSVLPNILVRMKQQILCKHSFFFSLIS